MNEIVFNDKVLNRIKTIILKMDDPFSIHELLEKLEANEITDKEAILSVLNQLLDSGLVEPYEIFKKPEKYYSIFSLITK